MEPNKLNETMKMAREHLIVGLHVREANAENPEPEDEKYFHVKGEPIVLGQETVLVKAGAWGETSRGEPFPDKDIIEVISKDALKECDISDVVLNVNHGDGNHAVARTRNKTIVFEEKEDGLYMDALLSKDNERCVQFYKDVSEGLLDRMSFAFTIPADGTDWAEEEERYVSTVTKIAKIYDVSAVEFPAYGQTSISEGRSKSLRCKAEAAASARALLEERKELVDLASEIAGRCAPIKE